MQVEAFILRWSPRWITVEPSNPAIPHDRVLYIDRNTLRAQLRSRVSVAALAEPDQELVIYGLVGLVHTLHDAHLLVIRSRQHVGTILGRDVFRISNLSAIPVRGVRMLKANRNKWRLSKQDLAEETVLRTTLLTAVNLQSFYYAPALDLTRSAQKRADLVATHGDSPALPDFTRADPRFLWNRFAASALVALGAVSWVTPVIFGFVHVRSTLVNGKSIQLALIARRAADRPGLRFTARGADTHGNCANFVETEQIVSHGGAYASFVQIRASIPLLWEQPAALIYKPAPRLKVVADDGGKSGLSQLAFEKHFDSLFDHYGKVTAVSLIDDKGLEQLLYRHYESAVKLMDNPKLHFVPWDFHARTKGGKYDRIEAELVPLIDADLEAYGYFFCKDGTPTGVTRRQRGVIRTNCIDTLDRTNVVQSVLAHRMLDAALRGMAVLDSNPESNSAARFVQFETLFRHLWADHANALSTFYAGSPAMKTDFTRTGKRSKLGLLTDGVNALRRYFYQNFLDGIRQDGVDLLLGVVQLPPHAPPPPSAATRSVVVADDDDVDDIDDVVDDDDHPHSKLVGNDTLRMDAANRLKTLRALKSKAEPLLVWEKFLPHVTFANVLLGGTAYAFIPNTMLKLFCASIALVAATFFARLTLKTGHKLVSRPKLDGTH